MPRTPRVLFIVHDLYQEDNHFPFGPAYMAAILKRNSVEVTVYCQDISHDSDDALADFLEKNTFDIIGIGFLAARFKETVYPLCKVINEYKKGAWLVLGGPGPSPIAEYMLTKTAADVVVIGEAESTITDLVRCKFAGGDLSRVDGIAYKDRDGSVTVNRRGRPVMDLDSIPLPEWSLFPMDKYVKCLKPFRAVDTDTVIGIVTSRGCVNRCNFCYRMEDGIRTRSVRNIIEEMAYLNKEYGVNYFVMYDELFVLSKKRMIDFKKALGESGLKIKFSCNARVDLFDEELAVLLKECGCQFLNFGMESSDQTVLDAMKKRTTVEQNIRAAEIVKKIGIGLGLNFIWGNIGDTETSLKNNVALIRKYNTYDQLRTIRPVTPYPGCDLYYEAIRTKKLTGPEDFFDRFNNSDLLTVNFTDLPEDRYYAALFEANKFLITDHYEHTTKDFPAAEKLISEFQELYFGGNVSFRGARHYTKQDSKR